MTGDHIIFVGEGDPAPATWVDRALSKIGLIRITRLGGRYFTHAQRAELMAKSYKDGIRRGLSMVIEAAEKLEREEVLRD